MGAFVKAAKSNSLADASGPYVWDVGLLKPRDSRLKETESLERRRTFDGTLFRLWRQSYISIKLDVNGQRTAITEVQSTPTGVELSPHIATHWGFAYVPNCVLGNRKKIMSHFLGCQPKSLQ